MERGLGYCLNFMPGTTGCFPGSELCAVPTTTITSTTTDTTAIYYGSFKMCGGCTYSTVGPCKMSSGGVCMGYRPGSEQCYSGSYACEHSVELIFSQDFRTLLPTEAAELAFEAAIRGEASSILGVDASMVTDVFLSLQSDTVAAVHFSPDVSRALVVLKALVDKCSFCIEYEDSIICPKTLTGESCPSIMNACKDSSCTNDAVCHPSRSSSEGYVCVCPQDPSARCYGASNGSQAIGARGAENEAPEEDFFSSRVYLVSGLVATLLLGVAFFVYAKKTSPTRANLAAHKLNTPSSTTATDYTDYTEDPEFDDGFGTLGTIEDVDFASFLNRRELSDMSSVEAEAEYGSLRSNIHRPEYQLAGRPGSGSPSMMIPSFGQRPNSEDGSPISGSGWGNWKALFSAPGGSKSSSLASSSGGIPSMHKVLYSKPNKNGRRPGGPGGRGELAIYESASPSTQTFDLMMSATVMEALGNSPENSDDDTDADDTYDLATTAHKSRRSGAAEPGDTLQGDSIYEQASALGFDTVIPTVIPNEPVYDLGSPRRASITRREVNAAALGLDGDVVDAIYALAKTEAAADGFDVYTAVGTNTESVSYATAAPFEDAEPTYELGTGFSAHALPVYQHGTDSPVVVDGKVEYEVANSPGIRSWILPKN